MDFSAAAADIAKPSPTVFGHSPSFVSLPDSRRSIYQAGAHVAIVTHS